MHIAAVKPAVPFIIASRMDKPSGSGITQRIGTRMYSDNPPEVFMPKS